MKFKFPLQKVLDHRKIKEDLAQKEFQEAVMALNELNAKLAEMEKAVHQAHLQLGTLQEQGGAQGPALSQVDEFIINQKLLIQRQKVKIQQQQKVVEDKRDLLRQAAVETKIISRFKEKKFAEYEEIQEKEEQKDMDEQSLLRFKTADRKKA